MVAKEHLLASLGTGSKEDRIMAPNRACDMFLVLHLIRFCAPCLPSSYTNASYPLSERDSRENAAPHHCYLIILVGSCNKACSPTGTGPRKTTPLSLTLTPSP